MDSRLSEVIVCPVCKGPVTLSAGGKELCCARCALAFPIVDGVPVM
ncbi:MAG: Trm112 family protein, partial [Duodenibacillus sp.]|nr:Trm112 family protein [Duodenibacillus sp.]